MLPASFAACVPVFIATATSACASAGASLVPSPVMATSRPPAWCSRISFSLASRRRFGQEIVDARFGGNRGGGQRVIARDHDRLNPHVPQFGKALLHAAFDNVLELDHAQHTFAFGHHQRRAALTRDIFDHIACTAGGNCPP